MWFLLCFANVKKKKFKKRANGEAHIIIKSITAYARGFGELSYLLKVCSIICYQVIQQAISFQQPISSLSPALLPW